MVDDLIALLDAPLALLIVMSIGGVIGMTVATAVDRSDRKRRRAYWQNRKIFRLKPQRPERDRQQPRNGGPNDGATDQLAVVMNAHFSARPLLNRSETQAFEALERIVRSRNSQWRVMAQVNLGEFLASKDETAYGCINSKRVDFALIGPDFLVQHALEYQGSGHHQGSAAARDAVKKESLRKAGIGYHEILAGFTTPSELKRLIEKLIPPES